MFFFSTYGNQYIFGAICFSLSKAIVEYFCFCFLLTYRCGQNSRNTFVFSLIFVRDFEIVLSRERIYIVYAYKIVKYALIIRAFTSKMHNMQRMYVFSSKRKWFFSWEKFKNGDDMLFIWNHLIWMKYASKIVKDREIGIFYQNL